MWRIYGGAILVIAGIAAFIEAHSHKPLVPPPERVYQNSEGVHEVSVAVPATGLSHTAYDLLRIGAWALVVLGAVTVCLGFVRYWRGS